MPPRIGEGSCARQNGMGAAQGICVGILLGLALFAGVIVLAMILRAVIL